MKTLVEGYQSTQELISADKKAAVALDERGKTLCLATLDPGFWGGYTVIGHRIIDRLDLVSADVVEDGETITRTMRMSQVGGAIVGGVLLGGVGALVGALTGKTSAKSKVRSLDLRITVNDLRQPMHVIRLLANPCMRGDWIYRSAAEQAEHWNAILSVLIKQADEENRQRQAEIPVSRIDSQFHEAPVSQLSVADELSKLARLVEMDLLTKDEFNEQKRILLRKGNSISPASPSYINVPRASLGVDASAPIKVGNDPSLLRKYEEFSYAILTGDLSEIEAIVYSGANINLITDNGLSPLCLAIHGAEVTGNFEIVKFLLEHGANPNIPSDFDELKILPLQTALRLPDLTEMLLVYGADPNLKFDDGLTILWTALMSDDFESAKILIKHGADVNAKVGSLSLLDVLMSHTDSSEKQEIVQFFVASGAKSNMATLP